MVICVNSTPGVVQTLALAGVSGSYKVIMIKSPEKVALGHIVESLNRRLGGVYVCFLLPSFIEKVVRMN